MKTCASRISVVLLFTAIFSIAKTPKQVDPWLVLERITHKRDYWIETRDRRCAEGTINEVTANHLTARIYAPTSSGIAQPNTVTFERTDILRVGSGRGVYYSGRSSWLDVGLIRAEGRERLQIVTSRGESFVVKPPYTVSDEGITFNDPAKPSKVMKSEIAQLYKIAATPLTAKHEYFLQEFGPMVIFDPQLYVYGLHLEGYVPVLLYRADEPEDNSSAQCRPDSP